jgi:MmyB-like transcription regulator ligand binding domain
VTVPVDPGTGILAANPLGRALYSEMYVDPVRPVNHVRLSSVAILRSEAGRDPHDRGLSDLVGELSKQSETFRTRWASAISIALTIDGPLS